LWQGWAGAELLEVVGLLLMLYSWAMMILEFENRVKNFGGGKGFFLREFARAQKVLAKLAEFQKKGVKDLFEPVGKAGKTAGRAGAGKADGKAKKAGSKAEKACAKVLLSLVSDAEIQALNKEYRAVNKATDVLSFSYLGGERFPGDDTVGEILISVAAAKRQAPDHGKTVKEELQFLFLHGLLHVFGFDHLEKTERKTMFDLQDKIIGNKSWRAIADTEADEAH
jgi:rRNA maturation RNase YbeY